MTNATTILPRLIATLILLAAAGAALLLTGALPHPLAPTAHAQTPATDYDANDNGLIDIDSIAKLNAIRWDINGDGHPDPFTGAAAGYNLAFPNRDAATSTRMGCPAGNCAGYELTDNLAFATSATWTPLGIPGTVRAHPYRYFGGTLDGNGHTITGLDVSVTSGGAGLFTALYNDATIRDLGLINPAVNSNGGTSRGALAGFTYPGVLISGVYAAGGSVTGTPSSNSTGAGGLVGSVRHTTVQASYSSASVSIGGSAFTAGSQGGAGGLVGRCLGCAIIASYATGAVTGTSPAALTNANFGGLVANSLTNAGRDSVITDSYCDSQTGGLPACIGAQSGAAVTATAYPTAQLQTPTLYLGIYRNWNLDLDGDNRGDYPWNFGTTTTYPTLNTPAQREAAVAAAGSGPYCPAPPSVPTTTATDYDANGNCLIEIANLDQLNALRWDRNGDGDPDSTTTAADYLLAFPNRDTATTTRMGCHYGLCAGYELTASLTFATSATWTPIIGFAATLDGAGHTITGLNVSSTYWNVGLFSSLVGGAAVRDLGLINPHVTGTDVTSRAGALAGVVESNAVVTGVYAQGGRIFGYGRIGGLVGLLEGELRASYATAAVSTPYQTARTGGLVGRCQACAITAAYAAGAVTSTAAATNFYIGGLLGENVSVSSGFSTSSIVDSYCAADATGQAACIGNQPGSVATSTAYAASELQAPTGYTGIYIHWNLDAGGDFGPDYLWNFGAAADYPTLRTPEQRAALIPAPVDYDANDNGLIEVSSIAQLHAIRWDLDGDGRPARLYPTEMSFPCCWVVPDPAGPAPGYGTAFPGRTVDMGCPGVCRGYELTASLTFPAATGTDYNPWTPIGRHRHSGEEAPFHAIFDGNGHTLTNLRIHRDLDPNVRNANIAIGLFAWVGNYDYQSSSDLPGVIRNVGLVNPRVTYIGTALSVTAGLVGQLVNGSSVHNSYVQGGRIASDTIPSNRYIPGHGGLVGSASDATIANSWASATVTSTRQAYVTLGGLVGRIRGTTIINSYAYGPVTQYSGYATTEGGLIGGTLTPTSTIVDSYCDTQAGGVDCIGIPEGGATSTLPVTALPEGKTTAELQRPTGYTGIYQNWAPPPGAPSLWNFGGRNDYPALYFQRQTPAGAHPQPAAPAADRDNARPPADDSDYNPAADHPEIYANDRYEMAATCQIHRNADGEPTGSTITFNLGSYEGEVLLALTLWNGDHFASYERMDAPHPTLNRNGQTATIQVATTPAQTRFLLDGRPHGLRTNLLLGYADCHTDDPGAESPPPTPTPTPTPAPPKVYRNAEYQMTATCHVQTDVNGNPETTQITFDLGNHQAEVTLRLSLWDGEYYTAYESHGLTQPNLERNAQTATVTITTDPTETVFLLNTTAKPTRNLLLGHADCHTAGG